MSGTNSLEETDRRPLDACLECLAKVCWLARYDPQERFSRLSEFCAKRGLEPERRVFESCLRALNAAGSELE